MDRILRHFRRRDPPSEKQWSELTQEEQGVAKQFVKQIISEEMDPLCGVLLHRFFITIPELHTILLCVPIDVFDMCMRELTPRPYVLMPRKEKVQALFVQNLERVTSLMAPSPHLARIAARDAWLSGGTCAISLEPYADLSKLCVGICGHVFSEAALGLDRCPTCREPIAWTCITRTNDALD